MRALGFEALVVQGANNLAGIGGNLRWLTGISAAGSYPQTVVFPAEGLMSLVMHGGSGEVAESDGKDPAFPGIGGV